MLTKSQLTFDQKFKNIFGESKTRNICVNYWNQIYTIHYIKKVIIDRSKSKCKLCNFKMTRLKQDVKETIEDISVGSYLFDKCSEVQATKAGLDKRNVISLRSFCMAKETVTVKTQGYKSGRNICKLFIWFKG